MFQTSLFEKRTLLSDNAAILEETLQLAKQQILSISFSLQDIRRGVGGVIGGYFRGDWAFEGVCLQRQPSRSINQGGPTWPSSLGQIGCRGESSPHSANSNYTPHTPHKLWLATQRAVFYCGEGTH